jgi:hypothetical protein
MREGRREELERVQLLFDVLFCRPVGLKRSLPLLMKKTRECEQVAEEKNCTRQREKAARKT